MSNYIHERIIQKNKLKGYLVAIKDQETGIVCTSYSLCHPYDKFNKIKGMAIAYKRALKWGKSANLCTFIIPHSISEQYARFVIRCKKYFKTDSICPMAYYG